MNLLSLVEIAVAVFALARIVVRQLRWTPLTSRSLWTLPLVLAAVGVVSLAGSHASPLTVPVLGVTAAELALSASAGAAMGALARLRPRASGADRQAAADARWEARGGVLGLVVFLGLVALRIGLGLALGQADGGASLTGTILLVIAANRLARSGVLSLRVAAPRRLAAA